MQYVEIMVASQAYHGTAALTYSSETALPRGTIVVVPLRAQQVVGVVVGESKKPTFTVKPVTEVPELPPLPAQLLDLLAWMQTYYPSPLELLRSIFYLNV